MCRSIGMPTNLAIDDDLLNEAKRLGGHRTKRETVNRALSEYVRGLKRRGLIDLLGRVEFNDFDYKKARKRR
jgi:Arc/MetJ family transcription regulator